MDPNRGLFTRHLGLNILVRGPDIAHTRLCVKGKLLEVLEGQGFRRLRGTRVLPDSMSPGTTDTQGVGVRGILHLCRAHKFWTS